MWMTHLPYKQDRVKLHDVCTIIVTWSFFSLFSPTAFSVNHRPLHSNRGQGGAIAQLQAVAKIICTEATKKKKTNVLEDISLNVMAPVEKGCEDLPFLTL